MFTIYDDGGGVVYLGGVEGDCLLFLSKFSFNYVPKVCLMFIVDLLCCLNCMLIVIFLSVQVHSSLHFILHEVVGCLFPCV